MRALVIYVVILAGMLTAGYLAMSEPWVVAAVIASVGLGLVVAWRNGALRSINRWINLGNQREADADDAFFGRRMDDVRRVWPWLGQSRGPRF